jgi:hypothetical protein
MTPTPDPLRDARATRAQVEYVKWDSALGLISAAVVLVWLVSLAVGAIP